MGSIWLLFVSRLHWGIIYEFFLPPFHHFTFSHIFFLCSRLTLDCVVALELCIRPLSLYCIHNPSSLNRDPLCTHTLSISITSSIFRISLSH